jgi:hypothetical protein
MAKVKTASSTIIMVYRQYCDRGYNGTALQYLLLCNFGVWNLYQLSLFCKIITQTSFQATVSLTPAETEFLPANKHIC